MRNYRHGDVNFHGVSEVKGIPITHHGTFVVAKGEATSSVHELIATQPTDMELYQDGDTLYLRVLAPVILRHTSDHAPLTIQPGVYRQVPEREVDWFGDAVVRKVVD